jgi:site-specific DNA recombinase
MENKIRDNTAHARVVGYGRVSTEKQEDNNSLTIQKEAYDRDKVRYGWAEFPFVEESGSGTTIRERDGIREVLRLVRSGELDGVWVIDTDRLCRPEDLRDLAEIYDAFVETDVKLVTPTRVYDLRVDNDLFSFDIEGVLAKHNRRRLLQNMNRGKIQTAKEGRNAGGSAPDGYLVDPKTGKYVLDPDRAEYARLAWDLVYNHDYTLRNLVKEYEKRGIRSKSGKKWSLTHFHDMFLNEEYLGKYIYGKTKFTKDRRTGGIIRTKVPRNDWIVVENAHESMVSQELFYGVQEKLRWRRKRLNHNTHMLTAIGTCYLCGHPLHVKYSGEKRKIKYVCTNKRGGCSSRWLDFFDLNERVWNKFKLILESPELIEKLATPLKSIEYRLQQLRERQKKIQVEIDKVETKKQKLLDLYLDGKYSKVDLDTKKEELEQNVNAYKSEYRMATAGIRALEEQPNDLAEIIKYMKVLHYTDTKLTYDQKVRIFRQFVFKVRFDANLDFEMELYKTPLGEIPANFRSFPKNLPETRGDGGNKGGGGGGLPPPVPVQTPVLDGLGNMLGQDVGGASQVTYSSSHLHRPDKNALYFPTIKLSFERLNELISV